MMFYLTNPIWTAPNGQVWEEALKDVFVIETSPFPSETAMYADIILPITPISSACRTRPTYPFEGWPMAQLRVPAVKPLYDTKYYGDTLIEIGKRMKARWASTTGARQHENVIRHLAKGFEPRTPATTASTTSRAGREGRLVQEALPSGGRSGVFYEWDGQDYAA
jgi:thiosulfate reductase / polysulfide reductase chain A